MVCLIICIEIFQMLYKSQQLVPRNKKKIMDLITLTNRFIADLFINLF